MQFKDDKLFVDWTDIDAFCLEMAHEGSRLGIEKVIGVSRGGLIPGVIISHLMGVPFDSITWQTRDGDKRDTKKVLNFNNPKYMIVDDMVDSGKTMIDLMCLAPDAVKAVIFNKKEDVLLDIVGQELYNVSEWVCFPWEND